MTEGLHYEGNIIRPPSEADSILLQVTVGCSHNKCAFCGAYKGERFRLKDEARIRRDLAFAAKWCKRQRRVFLCDGDVMILPQPKLLSLLADIRQALPWVTRVGLYANAKSVKAKSLDALRELKAHGLGMVYMGLESGDDETLLRMRKGRTSAEIVAQARKVREAGLKLSVTVILGLAGPERSLVHAEATGKALTAIDPEQAGALSLMLVPGTALYEDWQAGRFSLLDADGILRELKAMFEHTHLSRGLFLANHASNYLPIRAKLPKDRAATLALIDQALSGELALKPEWLRGL